MKKTAKLVLKLETLRLLDQRDLAGVVGGAITTGRLTERCPPPTQNYSCKCDIFG